MIAILNILFKGQMPISLSDLGGGVNGMELTDCIYNKMKFVRPDCKIM